MLIAFRIRDRNNFDFYQFGTVACAWHRQVRRADARRSQAHAAKRQQEQRGKPNRKARRSGAVPANPLGTGCRFSAAHGFLSLVFIVLHLLNFASFGRLRLA